ncbi:MAG TPA: DUF4230 domain-containing protein [Mariniphaga anaerophila]|uniref:DUF4230 domain-containing protein n=1 Tax=Mariniphaga anaerophila TaxID=1484053 RepID=A0A831LPV7_9BACT|nr:DUF4230 domain-containing protein [Mariniphaga anaerophila]
METLILLGVLLGLAGGIAGTFWFFKSRMNQGSQVQSTVLLNKIRHVCKLITVEGEFSEVFAHRDGKSMFFKLLQMEKKALLIVKAKVLIGFDLAKIHIEMQPEKRRVLLSHFPDPEIMSMETDLEFYDVQKGLINKFSEVDLTNMNIKSKEFIREKIERSYLFDIARNQAADTVAVIRQLIDSVGWELVAEDLELPPSQQRKIDFTKKTES